MIKSFQAFDFKGYLYRNVKKKARLMHLTKVPVNHDIKNKKLSK